MKYVRSVAVLDEEDGGATAVIRLSEKMEVLSSAPLNGGETLSDTVFIMQVPHDYDSTDYQADLEAVRRRHSLPEGSVGFMTSAEVKYVFSVSEDRCGDAATFVAATAGATNAVEAGEPLDRWEERKARSMEISRRLTAGTINIVVVSSEPLDTAGKVNLMIPLVEAKTLGLRDVGYHETGTTSDAMAVITPVSDSKYSFAGTGTDVGLAAARGVRKAVAECLRKRGEGPEPENALQMLAHCKISDGMLWDCASALGLEDDAKSKFSETIRAMAEDPDICAVVRGILAAGEASDKGIICGQDPDYPPEVLTDGTWGIFLAGKISQDRGGDSTVDLLRMRPLKGMRIKEYAEAAAYGLVGGVVGYMTGYSDERR